MGVPKNIAAFTPAEPNPAFLSINETAPGKITVTVRSALKDGSASMAEIELSEDAFALFVAAPVTGFLSTWIAAQNRKCLSS